MTEKDIAKTTTPTNTSDFTIGSESVESPNADGETFYTNSEFPNFFGKYQSTTKLKAIIKKYATWVVGLGLTEKSKTPVIENIRGSGEDTLLSVLWNMILVKKINGDAYSEIIRNDKGTLINLKPLNPSDVMVVFKDGMITRYEFLTAKGKSNTVIPVEKMFHIVNDRVANSMKGDSVVESLVWNLDAQEEAKRMYRKKVKNSGIIGIVKVATDNTGKLTSVKAPIKEGMENGSFLIVPDDVMEIGDWAMKLNTQELIAWLQHLDDEFYQILGIPKVIGGASGNIEGDSKISYVTFEPDYRRAIGELQDDFWNQVAIKIEFNLPTSLIPQLAKTEQANSSQTGFQPNDTQAGVGA